MTLTPERLARFKAERAKLLVLANTVIESRPIPNGIGAFRRACTPDVVRSLLADVERLEARLRVARGEGRGDEGTQLDS